MVAFPFGDAQPAGLQAQATCINRTHEPEDNRHRLQASAFLSLKPPKYRFHSLTRECRTKCRTRNAASTAPRYSLFEGVFMMDREAELLTRITTNPEIFGGKPITIAGHEVEAVADWPQDPGRVRVRPAEAD